MWCSDWLDFFQLQDSKPVLQSFMTDRTGPEPNIPLK